VCQVKLPFAFGGEGRRGVSAESDISVLYLELQLLWPRLQLHVTVIYHSQTARPCCTTCLSSTLYIEALLTHMYFSLTAFHFYIFSYNFLKSTHFTTGKSLSLHQSFLCLGKPCHLTANAMTTNSSAYSTAHKLFQVFRIP
jgi:hypothetical protein